MLRAGEDWVGEEEGREERSTRRAGEGEGERERKGQGERKDGKGEERKKKMDKEEGTEGKLKNGRERE